MQTESRALSALTPHQRNYRRHPDSQIAVLRDSLRIHGQQKPVVITPDGTILAGHALVEAAKAEGWEEMACHVYDGPAEYAEAFLIADNRTNELAENEWSALADLLQELDSGTLDIKATGYDAKALMELMDGLDAASAKLGADESGSLKSKFEILVKCTSEAQQSALLQRFTGEGIECRALIS